jgi:hypothetical protein
MLLFFAAVCVLSGCGDDDDDGMPKTLEAAKIKIRSLEAEVMRLTDGIKSIEDSVNVEKSELQLIVSQLRQDNDELTNAMRLGERIKTITETNDDTFFLISIGVNFLSLLVILGMQLRHRRLLDECNHFVTHTLHS